MISIRYGFITAIHENINDNIPYCVEKTYTSKEAAQKDMLSSTIEDLSNGKNGIIKEDCTITWRGDDKHDYIERVVYVKIIK